MYEHEKMQEFEWTKDLKKQVAEAASVQVTDVDDVLNKYKQLNDFHNWLRERKLKDLPMPESRDELMMIYRLERPKFLFQKSDKKKT